MEVNNIDFLSGIEFEHLCEKLIKKMGFETEITKASGDGGIDIIAYNHQPLVSGKYIIQCKRYTGSVGESIIRDLYGVITSERANKGILITTGVFTNPAIKFSQNKPIELIDGTYLKELLFRYEIWNDIDVDKLDDDEQKWIYQPMVYIKNREIIERGFWSWSILQKQINTLTLALTNSDNSPPRKIYRKFYYEVMMYLQNISAYNTLLCNYKVLYCKSIFSMLMGNTDAYSYFKKLINIISEHQKSEYDDDEVFTITVIIYNQIQMLCVLGFKNEAEILYKEWQHIFKLRIEFLLNKFEDNSIDWAEPLLEEGDDIEEIIEFMEEEKEEIIKEIEILSEPFENTHVYVDSGWHTFVNEELPADYFGLKLIDVYNCNYGVKIIPFIKENQEIKGIAGFPLW